jgi:periplasmic divalent cation tolerance protein
MGETAEMIAVYTTLPTEDDARRLGADLVARRLAACVNIFPGMISIYHWQNNVETGNETAMLVKTRKELQEQVIEAMAAGHPYTVPALIVFDPCKVAASYLEWLRNETSVQP